MPDQAAPGFEKNPDYPLTIDAFEGRVRTAVAGIVIADSDNTQLLRENTYPPVFYFPMTDVRVDGFLQESTHQTTCPYKGDAQYWDFKMGGTEIENIAWAYSDPYRECAAIRDHISFYWAPMDCWFVNDAQVSAPPA